MIELTTPFSEPVAPTCLGWLKEVPPACPLFDAYPSISAGVHAIKNRLQGHLIEAVEQASTVDGFERRLPSWKTPSGTQAWLAALLTKRYGRVYFLNRYEARSVATLSESSPDVTAIDELLADDGLVNRIYNVAVKRFLLHLGGRLHWAPLRLPPLAFSCADDGAVYVNEDDFHRHDEVRCLQDASALYDLHDFVHLATSSLSAELYGSKYFGDFARFPSRLKLVIRDPHFATARALPHSDGLVFRELSLGLFDGLPFDDVSETEVVDAIANALVEYYRGRKALLQPSTGAMVSAPQPLSVIELAVLGQNKAYEHSASEFEEQVITRGGPGDRDRLFGKSAAVVAAEIARASRLTYYDRRNYLRHRAHKEALSRYAVFLSSGGVELSASARELVEMTLENLSFADYCRGQRLNLFAIVQRHLEDAH